MTRSADTARLGNVLGKVFEQIEVKGQSKESSVFREWPRWVGGRAARHSRPVRIKDGQLLVYVDHPTWLYDLNQRIKVALLEKLSRALGRGAVTAVHFRLGRV
ncbi:MAG: DUF721 domain-containing protein [Candidatus Omnitrophica bacterium]|nr:DUF721 domain-containing protein [Candidatus Omnitrophota bacterium]